MPRVLLATNAAHDSPTEYLDVWSDKIMTLAQQYPDVETFDLKGDKANKEESEKMIAEKKPQLVIMHGHGNDDTVTGYKFEVLVKYDVNHSVLKDKIVHALSCRSGKKLAPECIAIGTTAYIGYKEDFQLVTLAKTTNEERANDVVAGFFLNPAFEIVSALIKGKTVDEAFKASQAIYKNNLLSLITSADPQLKSSVASCLYHNLQHQMYLGNGAATF